MALKWAKQNQPKFDSVGLSVNKAQSGSFFFRPVIWNIKYKLHGAAIATNKV